MTLLQRTWDLGGAGTIYQRPVARRVYARSAETVKTVDLDTVGGEPSPPIVIDHRPRPNDPEPTTTP